MALRSSSFQQLPLDLPATPALRREDYLGAPGNAAALSLIDAFPQWPSRVVCLVGPEGAGKSHLATIFAEEAGAHVVMARDLSRAQVPAALETGALVLEDLEAGGFDEAALFHLLNLAREQHAFVLMTARTPPSGFALATADLVSRLRAIPVFTIAPADDALLGAVLVKLFADRQLAVDGATVNYILPRMQRSVAGARRIVEALDTMALARKRPVTRALAAQLLREQPELAAHLDDGEDEEDADGADEASDFSDNRGSHVPT